MFSRAWQHKRTSSSPTVNGANDLTAATAVDNVRQARKRGNASASSIAVESPAASPPSTTFEFELPPTTQPTSEVTSPVSHTVAALSSPGNFSRPRVGDGVASAGKSGISVHPPVLPPIPRVASRYEKDRDARRPKMANMPFVAQQGSESSDTAFKVAGDSIGGNSTLKPRVSFEHPVDLLSLSARSNPSFASAADTVTSEATAAADSDLTVPKLEASLFPQRTNLSAATTTPAMSRSFIDSRDKPYSQIAPSKPLVRTTNNFSTPDLLASQSAVEPRNFNAAPKRPSLSRLRPQQSAQSLTSKTTSTSLSGSTARPSTQTSLLSGATSSSPAITIGTPYSATSASFPAPERVANRPKGFDATSNVSGVAVPTHFSSSSSKSETKATSDGRKKGRLLNPMSVFQRRRSAQDSDSSAIEERAEREAQAQALARQKDVAAAGVKRLPSPSIKGKVVHDFSAPRPNRNTFGEIDATMLAQFPNPSPPIDSATQSSSSAPCKQASRESSSRLGARTPVFKEHLDDDDDALGGVGSIHAENLENADFLQRASLHSASNYSQDTSILPPFARRSQVLDPAQAALFHDSDSKRSSGRSADQERDQPAASVSAVSPVGSHYPYHAASEPMRSISPVSPSTPDQPLHIPLTGLADKLSGHAHQQGDTLSHMQTTRSAPGNLALPPRGFVAESVRTTPSMPVSPIEPVTPTNLLSHQDPLQGSPLQLTPPDHGMGFDLSPRPAPSPNPTSFEKMTALDQTAGFPTPDKASEPSDRSAQQASGPPSQRKSIEKRKSARARSKRAFSGPKHHASTASRFSFQYASGESAAEEHALEDKHRSLVRRGKILVTAGRGPGSDEDDGEEDYFDEDAMDDMDEMEMEQHELVPHFPVSPMPSLPSQVPATIQQLHQVLQPDTTNGQHLTNQSHAADITDGHLVPYQNHAADRTQFAIATPHTSLQPGTPSEYWRSSTIDQSTRDSITPQRARNGSSASALTIDTNVSTFGNKGLSKSQSDRSVQSTHHERVSHPPQKDHSRVVSGMSFSSASDDTRSPPRGNSAQRAARKGAGLRDILTAEPLRNVLNSQPASPPLSHTGSISNVESSYHTSKSMSTPLMGNVMSDQSAKGTGNNLTPVSGGLHASTEQHKTELGENAGLGLNASSSFSFDRSPIIPHQHSESKNSQTRGTRTLGDANILTEKQHDHRWNSRAAPSPPATVEMKGATTFDSSKRPANLEPPNLNGPWKLPQYEDPHQLPISGGALSGFNFIDPASPVSGDESHADAPNPAPLASHDFNAGTIGVASPMLYDTLVQSQPIPSQWQRAEDQQQIPLALPNDSNDDMYYDDGNFNDEDLYGLQGGDSIDENAFDDEDDDDKFVHGGTHHRRDNSAMTINSVGSDGPYPAFAMPNAAKVRQHESHLMLEDLPLQGVVDPEAIPRRNPSEDAKRLGPSNKFPPPPFASSDKEAHPHAQATLQLYHAALADAANKAAADGRFSRVASASTARTASTSSKLADDDQSRYSQDARSMFSDVEHGFEPTQPQSNGFTGVGRSMSQETSSTRFTRQSYSPQKMTFDFGFDQGPIDDEVDPDDDDLVAAANAEALASDDEGFYGQEFQLYGRPRSSSSELDALHGGYFGDDGDDGIVRNRSLKEPNLTPITERSEFSTRNSFIGLGQPWSAGGPASAGPFGPHSPALARLPVSPWTENDITSLEQLRKLRANTFGGSQTSLASSNRSSAHSLPGFSGANPGGYSPNSAHAIPVQRPNYLGGAAMAYGSSNDSSGSSNPSVQPYAFASGVSGNGMLLSPSSAAGLFDSPTSATLSSATASGDASGMQDTTLLATPKRPSIHSFAGASAPMRPTTPPTARRVSAGQQAQSQASPTASHSRKGSGTSSADAVTYVREPDPSGTGKQRWVLERRRTSSQGQLELVGRELVQGGWI